eukprot:GDKI01024357.1.p2 GENE.GDKI01024357.1~~GDKI01024357.1.p2  ORF type:complete len:105 (-),score=6.04 GDKI01024357.1:36-350(-)
MLLKCMRVYLCHVSRALLHGYVCMHACSVWCMCVARACVFEGTYARQTTNRRRRATAHVYVSCVLCDAVYVCMCAPCTNSPALFCLSIQRQLWVFFQSIHIDID